MLFTLLFLLLAIGCTVTFIAFIGEVQKSRTILALLNILCMCVFGVGMYECYNAYNKGLPVVSTYIKIERNNGIETKYLCKDFAFDPDDVCSPIETKRNYYMEKHYVDNPKWEKVEKR
jgi:hypothetical protein